MSATCWALSTFFVWHIVSTVLGALASSRTVPPVVEASGHPQANRLAATLTPIFDRIATVAAPIPAALDRAAGPMRGVFDGYLALTGLGQNWQMFSAPPKGRSPAPWGSILRRPSGSRWQGRRRADVDRDRAESLPAHREDQLRFLQSYRDSFRRQGLSGGAGAIP